MSKWTADTVRKHLEKLFDAQWKAHYRAHDQGERTLNERLATEQQRTEKVWEQHGDKHLRDNEIREQLRAQADSFATRESFENLRERVDGIATEQVARTELIVEHRQMKKDVEDLKTAQAGQKASTDRTLWLVGIFVTVVLTAVVVVVNIIAKIR